jgi:hypothetical protein
MKKRCAVLAALAAAVTVSVAVPPAGAAEYSCGSTYVPGPRCYAIATWREQPEYFGAFTDITRSFLHCERGWGCDGSVGNVVWMVDDRTPVCRANRFGMCWVEAGYGAFTDFHGPAFYWAEQAPGGQYNFHLEAAAWNPDIVDHGLDPIS